MIYFSFFATTYTLNIPDFSAQFIDGIANFIIACCYFAIGTLIALGLWRNRANGFDTFATVTAGIFFSCAFGHICHAGIHVGIQSLVVWQSWFDSFTIIPAIAFLSLSNRYQFLVGSTQILRAQKELQSELEERQKATTELEKLTTQLQQENHERTVAQQQLKASGEFLNNILNAISDPIFVKDSQHRWLSVNDAFCQLMGQPREILLGKSDYEFFTKTEADIFWEKDELVFRTGLENENEEKFTDAAGEIHWISTKKTVFTDATAQKVLVGTIRDITSRVQMEDQLRQTLQEVETSQRLLRAVIDATPQAIFWKDTQGVFLGCNQTFARWMGQETPDLLIGKTTKIH